MNCSCNLCGITSFKTNQAYQRHLQTNKHKLRQENTREDLFQCNQCTKWYCGKSGLSHHKNICHITKISIPEELPTVTASLPSGTVQENLQQQIDELKQAFEIERQEMKAQIAILLDKHAGSGTTNNNTNNIETQNVHIININAFGNENTDYIDDKAILACIGRVYKSIPALLEKIHFDPKHPENHIGGHRPPKTPTIVVVM